MNSHRNTGPAESNTTLRERAATLRASTARKRPADFLDDCLHQARSYAEQFDFSAFDVIDATRLYEIVKQLNLYLGHLGNMPLCTEPDARGIPTLTPVGRFIEAEENRMAFLRDRCVVEIARRVPNTEQERDEILGARISHALDCGHRIEADDEPGLLIEALKAWG